MIRNLLFIALILVGCKGKVDQERTDNQSIEVDSAKEYFENPEGEKVMTMLALRAFMIMKAAPGVFCRTCRNGEW